MNFVLFIWIFKTDFQHFKNHCSVWRSVDDLHWSPAAIWVVIGYFEVRVPEEFFVQSCEI